jgi:uncharacterized protein YdaU (DUF1376 family)
MPFFLGDLLAATPTWTGEERALYTMLLAYQWTAGPLPKDAARLCRMVQYDRVRFDEIWSTVRSKFRDDGHGSLINARLEEHREKSRQLSEKNSHSGRKGAEVRWRSDGERHTDANGEQIANATKAPMAKPRRTPQKRHPKNDGVRNGNPSHPIPSHPNPSPPSESETSVGSAVVESTAPPTRGGGDGEVIRETDEIARRRAEAAAIVEREMAKGNGKHPPPGPAPVAESKPAPVVKARTRAVGSLMPPFGGG